MDADSRDFVVSAHADVVHNTAGLLVRTLPPNFTVDDLIQVGMLALIEAAQQKYDPNPATFRGYLTYRIRGAILDFVRSNFTPAVPEHIPEPRTTAEPEAGIAVRQAVDSLPPDERQVIRMAYWGEHSQRQIGDETGVSQVRVCQRHRSALRALRHSLEHVRAAA